MSNNILKDVFFQTKSIASITAAGNPRQFCNKIKAGAGAMTSSKDSPLIPTCVDRMCATSCLASAMTVCGRSDDAVVLAIGTTTCDLALHSLC